MLQTSVSSHFQLQVEQLDPDLVGEPERLDLLLQRAWAITVSAFSYTKNVEFHYIICPKDDIEIARKIQLIVDTDLPVSELQPRALPNGGSADSLLHCDNISILRKHTSALPIEYFYPSGYISSSSGDLVASSEDGSSSAAVSPVTPGHNPTSSPDSSWFESTSTLVSKNDELDKGAMSSQVSCADPFVEYHEVGATAIFEGLQGLSLKFKMPNSPFLQISSILATFEAVIHQALISPEMKVGELDLCSAGDVAQLRGWNALDGQFDGPREGLLECIRDYAMRQPGLPAAQSWDGTISYSELEDLSSKLAAHLMSVGFRVSAETPCYVPLLFEKSYKTVVSVIAVVKTGCAFVLLDPSQPLSRLRLVCEELKPRMIICSGGLEDAAAALAPTTVSLDGDIREAAWAKTTLGAPSQSIEAGDRALYAVFTSGSTGRPKGITIHHDAFLSCAQAYIKTVGMDKNTRALQFASYAFDVSISDMLNSLLVGGCLCIPSDVERMQDVAKCIRRLEPNWADLTPSLLRHLSLESLHTIKTVIVSGEALPRDVVESWANQIRLINVYGPAECSVQSTMCMNVSPDRPWNIGKAIVGATWIVDPSNHERLSPIGAIGELLIEGPHLGRGYLNEAVKTQKAFVCAPKWLEDIRGVGDDGLDQNGHRLYCTGDLVQYEADGSLRYVGRKDRQIKLRGQRLELEEVEHHLRKTLHACTDVVAEMVAISHGQSTTNALVAFLTHDQEMHATPGTESLLRTPVVDVTNEVVRALEKLQAAVPEYMVPSLFLSITHLPLTASGKIDRRRLREEVSRLSKEEIKQYMVGLLEADANAEPSGPSSTTAVDTISEVFAAMLNVNSVSSSDDFFALGGDSISAMRIVSRCRQEGLVLETGDILRHRTVGKIASVAKPTAAVPSTTAQDLSAIESDVLFDLSPIQRMFFADMPSGDNYFNQSLFVEMTQDIDLGQVADASKALVQRHPMLRARFTCSVDGVWRQRISNEIGASFVCQEFRLNKREDVTEAMKTVQKGFDLNKGPIFSLSLIRISTEACPFIFINTHHAVMDLVSYRIVLEDLEEHLRTASLALQEAAISFQWWCRAQADWSRRELEPEVVLPRCRRRIDATVTNNQFWAIGHDTNTYGNAHCVPLFIDEHVTKQILTRANDAFRTEPVELLNTALLHSFLAVFAERHPPTIFNEGHGREAWDASIDLSRTVGWFTTIWPIPVDFDHDHEHKEGNVVDLVRRVKDARRQVPGKGLPYFSSRHLNENGIKAFQDDQMEIVFNFHGKFQQFERNKGLFRQVTWDYEPSSDYGPDTVLPGIFEITCAIIHGRLKFEFIYGKNLAHQERILQWMQQCQKSLELIGKELCQASAIVPTLCDLPGMVGWGYDDLDQLGIALHHVNLSLSDVEAVYPCLPMQDGILLSRSRQSALYQTGSILEFRHRHGRCVSIGALCRAWQQVVSRHAALRTVMMPESSSNRSFNNVVLKAGALPLALTTTPFQSFDQEVVERESVLAYCLKYRRGLATVTCSPYQITLLFTRDARSVFCDVTFNHAIMDGWSSTVVVNDWVKAYESSLPDDSMTTYGDYVSFALETRTSRLDYWREYMAQAECCLFPTLVDHDTAASDDVYRVDVKIDHSGDTLPEFFRTYGVTMASLYHVAWALLLRAYTGRDDVSFGFLTSGRDLPVPEIERAVGLFANLLPCRVKMADTSSILSLLHETQSDLAAAMSHQHTSLMDIQAALGLNGDALFNTVISLQYQDSTEMNSHSSVLIVQELQELDPTEYDLALSVFLQDTSHKAYISYRTAAVSPWRAKNVADSLTQIISQILVSPWKTAQEISYLGDSQHATLHNFNRNAPIAVDACVHSMIQQQTQNTPHAPAVNAWDGCLSYRELDEKSSAVAKHLNAIGYGVGNWIAIYLERCVWVPVAMLGAIKSGAAFVLLEPSLPDARLQKICDETNAVAILTSMSLGKKAERMHNRCIAIDSKETQMQDTGNDTVLPQPCASDPIYAIFTSGSTGNPKGVVIEHGSFASSAFAHGAAAGYTAEARVLQFSSYAFDACMPEILTTLVFGGCVCIPGEHDRWNDLPGAVARLAVNHLFTTPSMLRTLDPASFPGVKTILVGGEPLSAQDIQQWFGAARVIQIYGPTECSAYAAAIEQRDASSDVRDIGTLLGGRAWIVDQQNPQVLAPIGAIGELVIEGPIVGRGYLNNPEQTAEAFISPPEWRDTFPCPPQRHLYRTGDLAQYMKGGSIRIFGRKDTQVKLRGQRIELGEIQHALYDALPGFPHIFVEMLKFEDDHLPAMLVALVGKQGDDSNTTWSSSSDPIPASLSINASQQALYDEAKLKLSRHLPHYMVPSLFFTIHKLPRTLGGKADRRLLRAEAMNLAEQHHRQCPSKPTVAVAQTSEEKLMLALVGEALGRAPDSLRMRDNFFQIGGDSLRAMKLAQLARSRGLALTVQDIFRAPQLSTMAALVPRADTNDHVQKGTVNNVQPTAILTCPAFSLLDRESANNAIRVAIEKLGVDFIDIEDIYPCTPLQQGMIFSTMRKEKAYVAQNTFSLAKDCDLAKLKAAWTQVYEANAILRTRIIQTDAGTVQVVLRGQFQFSSGDSLHEYLCDDQCRAMGLNEFLLRVAFIPSKAEENARDDSTTAAYMVVTIHHALYDGWSEALILDQLEAAYSGQTLPLRQYAPFVKHIQDQAHLAEQFWSNETAATATLAAIFPPAPSLTYQPSPTSVSNCFMDLTAGHTSSAFTLASQLRLAWAMVLHHFTCSEAVLFGVIANGRSATMPGIEDVTGPTLATLPCKINLKSCMTVEEILFSIQETSSRSIPYEQFGLQNMQKLNNTACDDCNFQSLLVVQPKPDSSTSKLLRRTQPKRDVASTNTFDTYPLTLQCTLLDTGVQVEAAFDAEIITEARMQQVLHHFKYIFDEISHDISRPVAEISSITSRDATILAQWYTEHLNNEPQESATVHQLIARHCQSKPTAAAIYAYDGNFSYSDIDYLSSALATRLILEGVEAESIVPVCMEKSKWIAVAMLAVIKVGAAFVLLDPSTQPMQRMQLIANQVQAKLILTSESLLSTAEKISSGKPVLASNSAQFISADSSPPGVTCLPETTNKASLYVIFTSGSTGAPKGVVIEHHGYVAGALSRQKVTGLDAASRVLQFSSCTFDTFITDILDTLIAGGCVCMPSDTARSTNLGPTAAAMGVTYADLVPSVARLLSAKDIPSLRTLCLSGEPVTASDVAYWSGKVQLCNLYGPAECSAVATGHAFSSTRQEPRNIGRGLGGRCWVVNPADADRLVPIGAVGELVLEGAIVGRGYLGPMAAQCNFLDVEPAWRGRFPGGADKVRMYKTGDLVQYQQDGALLFVGRKDNQVKLHGQRLELGDVEHHLRHAFPTALDAIAAIAPVPSERLVAFIVIGEATTTQQQGISHPTSTTDSRIEEIHITSTPEFRTNISSAEALLRSSLPSYMVPTAYLPLPHPPRTPSGKIDRKRLQHLATSSILRDGLSAFTAPRSNHSVSTDAQQKLQAIWAQVLDVEPATIGAEDGFLALGGDSIAAMKVASLATKSGLLLSIPKLFKNESLRSLTAATESHEARAGIIWDDETTILETMEAPISTTPLSNASTIEVILTGTTGILGKQVLQQLLASPSIARIHCIAVRHPKTIPSHPKLTIYTGDLSHPSLGLSAADEAVLSQCCRSIIHCGALVSFAQPYSTMRAVNVTSTKVLASLALRNNMAFHYISTAGVGQDDDGDAPLEEASAAGNAPPADGQDGYTATKWVSEVFLEKTHTEFGLDVTIHRPSNILCVGDPGKDLVNNILVYSRHMGAVPRLDTWSGYFDLIQGHTIASNIVNSVLTILDEPAVVGRRSKGVRYIHESGETVFPVAHLGAHLAQDNHEPLQAIPIKDWVERARKEGMDTIVGDFLCKMDESRDKIMLPRIKTSRQP
ncbi:hypothetical protein MY11210_006293 [Beauveria gryllotalpidicola]